MRFEKEVDEIVEILVTQGFFESVKGNVAEFLYHLPTDMPWLAVRNKFPCPLLFIGEIPFECVDEYIGIEEVGG